MIPFPTLDYIVNNEMTPCFQVGRRVEPHNSPPPAPSNLDLLVAAYAGPSDITANAQYEAVGNGD